MREHYTVDGIVLRTYDIGEADRLCIVLTKERGRMAARARAVRKLGSRIGPLLLPGRRVAIDVQEDGPYATIVAARLNGVIVDMSDPIVLAAAQQGIESVLLLTQDGEPLPEVFDVLFQFLHVAVIDPTQCLVPFRLKLFHVLGLLPEHDDDSRFAALNEHDRSFVRLCIHETDFRTICSSMGASPAIRSFAQSLHEHHAGCRLRSADVFASIAA